MQIIVFLSIGFILFHAALLHGPHKRGTVFVNKDSFLWLYAWIILVAQTVLIAHFSGSIAILEVCSFLSLVVSVPVIIFFD